MSNENVDTTMVRPTRRSTIILATGVNSISVLVIQVLGLTALAPAEFGLFSVQYLLFALASSIGLSTLSEPWLRTDLHKNYRSSWRDYSSFLLYLSSAAGSVTLVFSLFLPELKMAVIAGTAAVIASTYRSGARYYQVRMGRWSQVLTADVTGLSASLAVWLCLYLVEVPALLALYISWAMGALASTLQPPWPIWQGPRSIGAWLTTHRQQIGPLLRDSTLMDLGAIGTPFALAPALGIASFGVYRAVSNVAAPVRLILNPIRPNLAGLSLSTHRSARRILVSLALSLAFGVAAYSALAVIEAMQLRLGSLTALVAFAAPTSIFVAASFLGHYYYIIARAHVSGRPMLVGRIVQTLLSMALPLAGVAIGGLSAAVWGYSLATATSSVVWLALVLNAGTSKTR